VSLYRVLKEFKPDIIHVHTPFVLGILGTIFAQLLHVPLVSTYHTLFSQGAVYLSPRRMFSRARLSKIDSIQDEQSLMAQIIWKLQIIFFNISDAVIAPTQVIADTLKKQGIKTKMRVLPSGLDSTKFTEKTAYTSTMRVLHLGRLGLEKSTDVILKAFSQVIKKLPKAQLIIAGDGPAKVKLQRITRELHLQNNVTFLGQINNNDAPALYRSCDVFTTASTFETQGLVLLEAMLSGLPVVAAAVNAPCELIEPGKNGYLFKEGNDTQCAEQLISLLKKPALIKMGKNAREYGVTFDSSLTSNKLISYYRILITSRRS
jgi:glycosyltransferase involved in cell wall biosynthesis